MTPGQPRCTSDHLHAKPMDLDLMAKNPALRRALLKTEPPTVRIAEIRGGRVSRLDYERTLDLVKLAPGMDGFVELPDRTRCGGASWSPRAASGAGFDNVIAGSIAFSAPQETGGPACRNRSDRLASVLTRVASTTSARGNLAAPVSPVDVEISAAVAVNGMGHASTSLTMLLMR